MVRAGLGIGEEPGPGVLNALSLSLSLNKCMNPLPPPPLPFLTFPGPAVGVVCGSSGPGEELTFVNLIPMLVDLALVCGYMSGISDIDTCSDWPVMEVVSAVVVFDRARTCT